MKLTRNIFTNIVGVLLSLYGSAEVTTGKMTPERLAVLVPLTIISFVTGSKDAELKRLRDSLPATGKSIARGAGSSLLNKIVNPFGLTVSVKDAEAANRGGSVGRGSIVDGTIVGRVRDQAASIPESIKKSIPEPISGALTVGGDVIDRLDKRLDNVKLPDVSDIAGLRSTFASPSKYDSKDDSQNDSQNEPKAEAWD